MTISASGGGGGSGGPPGAAKRKRPAVAAGAAAAAALPLAAKKEEEGEEAAAAAAGPSSASTASDDKGKASGVKSEGEEEEEEEEEEEIEEMEADDDGEEEEEEEEESEDDDDDDEGRPLPFARGGAGLAGLFGGANRGPPARLPDDAPTTEYDPRLGGRYIGPSAGCTAVSALVRGDQLAVANAFEDLLHSRWPRFGRLARATYDRLGLPVSRYITRPWMADAVFLAMKPFEWAFYATLLVLDRDDPERRIDRMYR